MRALKRWRAMLAQPGTGGLIQPGDFRVIYGPTQHSSWMSYGDAKNLATVHGGHTQWRGDARKVTAGGSYE